MFEGGRVIVYNGFLLCLGNFVLFYKVIFSECDFMEGEFIFLGVGVIRFVVYFEGVCWDVDESYG